MAPLGAGHVSPGDTWCSAVWADTEVRGGHQYPDGRVQTVLRVTSGVQAHRAQFFINRPLRRRQLNVIHYQTKLGNQIQPTENHKKIYCIFMSSSKIINYCIRACLRQYWTTDWGLHLYTNQMYSIEKGK